MAKTATPKTKKYPYPANKFQRFKAWLVEHAVLYGITEDPDCERAIDILIECIDQNLGKTIANMCKKKRTHKESLAFIEEFKSMYLKEVGINYAITLQPKDFVKIARFLNNINAQNTTFHEYLEWIFSDFIEKKPDLNPTINLIVSDSILQNYLFANKDRLALKEKEIKGRKELESLMNQSKILWRETKNPIIKESLRKFQKGEMSRYEFKEIINKIEKENK